MEQLSRRTQLSRLRRLAATALAAYDLPAARLTLLSHFSNTTFRVDTVSGARYVLRIHRTHTPTVASVGAELAWLAALRRDTDLEVPDPVPTRDGSLLREVATPDIPTLHICVLFLWLPGRQVNAGLTPAHLERVGEAMARLQDHAAQFSLPPGFTRARVDAPIEAARRRPDPFAPEVIAACVALVAENLSTEEAALVGTVLARVAEIEQALGQDRARSG